MTIQDGSLPDANDVRNLISGMSNLLMGKNSTMFLPIQIENASGVRSIKLWLWGKKAGLSDTSFVHGSSKHAHGTHTHLGALDSGSFSRAQGTAAGSQNFTQNITSVEGGEISHSGTIDDLDVPEGVQIFIDGVNKTADIGDPNGRGAGEFDAGSDTWGVDGTSEWQTLELDLTPLISWTAGLHDLEIKETGGTGGVLVWMLQVQGW